jgi:predicted methyltransferase
MKMVNLCIFLVSSVFSLALYSAEQLPQSFVSAIENQPADVKERYGYRHPEETLSFFGVTPGMTVYEALPGRGWYTKILAAGLGQEGKIVGVDYPLEIYSLFGFFSEERLAKKKTWAKDWVEDASTWAKPGGAEINAFVFGTLADEVAGKADMFLLIRALHNLARFEQQGGHLTLALQDVFRSLKPGGVVGVVQHLAPESATDEWANGSNGYLKKSFVIEKMKKAGFKLEAESDVNLNPLDHPSDKENVWRLPPSMSGGETSENQMKYKQIGESTRMTLRFRKPD